MFAHLRSNPGANYRIITESVATTMRGHARNQRPILTGLDPSNANIAGILAEIHLRELACAIQTLQQVNHVASRYHEHAFDNTDAYIDGQAPTQTQEMNAEQRHAAQLLLGVGNSFSEVNAAIRTLDAGSFQAVMDCGVEMRAKLSQKFSVDASFAEDALERVQHVAKQVWGLVNMLAFSNLFRFADPRQPMGLPNPEDSIFIPYVPTARHEAARHAEEVQTQQTQTQTPHVDPSHTQEQQLFNRTAELLADGKITPEQACSFIEKLRDAGILADDVLDPENLEQEKQKGFNEIAGVLSDWKITTEEACEVFVEWLDEWQARENLHKPM